jgi:hypothetical protein
MLFGKRDKKKPSDRVLDLKARVDALRQADSANRKQPYSLDHFLEGDDVLTGREVKDDYAPEPHRQPEHAAGPAPEGGKYDFEVDLEAELQKYLKRQEEQALKDPDGSGETFSAPSPPASAPVPAYDSEGLWGSGGEAPSGASARPSPWPDQAPLRDLAWPEAPGEGVSDEEWPPLETAQ